MLREDITNLVDYANYTDMSHLRFLGDYWTVLGRCALCEYLWECGSEVVWVKIKRNWAF